MKQRQPTKRAHPNAWRLSEIYLPRTHLFIALYAAYRRGGGGGGGGEGAKELRGVFHIQIAWLRVEFLKGKKKGKDIVRRRA